MATQRKREKKLEHKPVHMCQRKHAQHAVAGMQKRNVVDGESDVAPEVAVGEHHTLGISGGS